MGAHDIQFQLDGDKTFSDVLAEFNKRQRTDRDYNGHREGYSGDFQTVSGVKDHGSQVFDDYNKAFEYCMDKALKWEYVIAVKYKVGKKYTPSKTMLKLKAKLDKEYQELVKIQNEAKAGYQLLLDKKRVLNCTLCKSRLNVKYLNKYNPKCPVCPNDLFKPIDKKKVNTATKKYQKTQAKLKALQDKMKAKGVENYTGTKWLVAGWGAC